MDVKKVFIILSLFLCSTTFALRNKNFNSFKHLKVPIDKIHKPKQSKVNYDLPITYNKKVKKWVKYFQGNGKNWFTKWLKRSYRYKYLMKTMLKNKGLPQDLFYLAMIESGFSSIAKSHASAVGYWQFIKPTANRYGLATKWWIDERRDFVRSTTAAINYLSDLNDLFGHWYLAASAYNMGENRLKRLIKKHKTKNFWKLSSKRDFPQETREYIPKLIAAMLIAKNPKMYGFHNYRKQDPLSYEYYHVPGGTDLVTLAGYLRLSSSKMKKLNPSILKGYIPNFVKSYPIRIPRGMKHRVARYIRGY